MRPFTIVTILDNQLPRSTTADKLTTWAGRRGQRFTAQIDANGDVHKVTYRLRPGVYIERTAKFSRPYGAPK
jgi:hypothetical protein